MSSMEEGDRQAAAVATAPRVTLADLMAKVAGEYYIQPKLKGAASFSEWFVRQHFEVPKAIAAIECLTICILVIENGFTVVGKSACASPANFDADLGRKFAREDAIRQLWALEGYLLRERLSRA